MTNACRLAYFLAAFAITMSLRSEASFGNDAITFTRLQLADDQTFFGEVIAESEDRLLLFDMVAGTSVSVSVSNIVDRRDGIAESESVNYVPFATYAAWKLTQLVKSGRVESTIVRVSEDNVYIGRGHSSGIEPGQKVILLGEPLEITDPDTGEVLGSVREEVGTAKVMQILSDRLSSIEVDNTEGDSINLSIGTVVAIDRDPRTVVVAKPSWKSEGSELRTGDEALFLHVQMISELVKYGFPVISRARFDQIATELATRQGKAVSDVMASEVASELKADVLLESEILAKGVTGVVTVEATNMGNSRYLGVMNGSIRRQSLREDSKRSHDFAKAAYERRKYLARIVELEKRLSMMGVLRLAKSFKLDKSGQLTEITITGAELSKSQIAQIANQRKLRTLTLGDTNVTDSDVETLSELSELHQLGLWVTKVSPASMRTVAESFPKLRMLVISGTSAIDRDAVSQICRLRNLSWLDLGWTGVGDEDLEAIIQLPKLRVLSIRNSSVTDAGLAKLVECDSLERVNVTKTQATEAGVERLKAALPNCQIGY